ncbi:hypothetical protein [Haloferula sp. BvORR071]|uniref:hypothetical protein n=1 Tax=Haloferula sp. BvORR071 TaxID=1396141 RepID=UPI000550D719|nr:hypothetical protein [Haloferula sp. BvORR071]
MQTTTNNDPPLRGPFISKLLEIATKTPTLLLERLLITRIQLQWLHSSPCPLVMIVKSESNGETIPLPPSADPWISEYASGHGLLTPDGRHLKAVFPLKAISLPIEGCDLFALHPATLSQSEWSEIDIHTIARGGQCVVTIPSQRPVPSEWADALDELFSSFRSEALCGFEATNGGFDDMITPAGFLEALDGFPDQFVEAMCTLAGEIDHLVGHIAAVAGSSQEESEFELCDEISKACIGAMVPGIRALAFHGFGWPILPPADAKIFLGKIRDMQPVSVETIASFRSDLDSGQREELFSFLLKAGLLSTDGTMISLVEPANFFVDRPGALTPTTDASPIA